MKKHKASISIFLVIILLSNIIFGGLFIDLSRILVAKNRVRTATESAARSTLAGYSEDLVSDWGLFALLEPSNSESEAKKQYDKYLSINLNTDNKEKKLNLLKYDIVKTDLKCSKPLSEAEIFQDEINEYSKYRTPVSLTLGVIDKFKAIFGDGEKDFDIVSGITNKIDDYKSEMKKGYDGIFNISTSFSSDNTKNAKTEIGDVGQLSTIDKTKLDNMSNDIENQIKNSKQKVTDYKDSMKKYQDASDEAQKSAEEFNNKTSTKDSKEYIDDNLGDKKTFQNSEDVDKDKSDLTEEEKQKLNDAKAEADEKIKKEKEAKEKVDNQIAQAEVNADNLSQEVQEEMEKVKQLADKYNEAAAEYNEKYDYIKTELSSISFEKKITADDAINCDIEAAKNYINADKFKKLGEKISQKKTELEISTATELAAENNLQEKNLAYSKLDEEINKLDNKLTENNITLSDNTLVQNMINEDKEYPTLKQLFEQYEAEKKETNETNEINMQKFFDNCKEKLEEYGNECNKAQKIKKEATQNLINVQSEIKKLDDIKKEMESDDYKLNKFVCDNSNKITAAVEAKNAAKAAADAYNEAISKIEQINPQEKITVVGNNGEKVESFNKLSGIEDDGSDKDKIDLGAWSEKLNSIKETVEKIGSELSKTLPGAKAVEDADLDGSSISIFNKLIKKFNALGKLITDPGNKIYIVDYIMNKCTYITSQTPRNHYFNYAEVEYIIFGYESQFENIMAAVGDIMLIRFAINAINYWLTTPGGLISRTVGAVGRGLVRTVNDMATMLIDPTPDSKDPHKGLIAICPSLSEYKVLSYSDHLRILLLMKLEGNGGADALRRCIHATMKENYGENIKTLYASEGKARKSSEYLDEYYTCVTATSEVDVELYFIPIFMPKFLNFGNIHNGKYRVTSSVTYEY